jgi:hypothetical protein
MKTAPWFDIHLASDIMCTGLEQRLRELGFKKDAFIGGTTGVIHPCHYSIRPTSREMLDQCWTAIISILSTVSENEFYGYAEAEITPHQYRTLLPWKPFDASVVFPFGQLEHEKCPLEKYKDFDIHITVDLSSIDPKLKQFLEKEIVFHYVDIRKLADNVVRVYTFQPLGLKKTPHLYKALLTYFQKSGGLEGKIKLEMTYAFARFPRNAPVPPVLMKIPHIRDQTVVTA